MDLHDERELTRWRALFSAPELCEREVSRLRETVGARDMRVCALESDQRRLTNDLATERAAHEATKAEFAAWKDALESDALKAAEARVAELERKLAEANATCVSISEYWRFQYAHRGEVIDQARGLLGRAPTRFTEKREWWAERDTWLRAHPATANATPQPVGLNAPPLTREQYLEAAERVSPSPRWSEPATPAAKVAEPRRMSERRAVWYCKVGRLGTMLLPDGCDLPMRMAVRDAYQRVAGVQADFIFSGWNTELSEPELAVVEDREPRVEKEQKT